MIDSARRIATEAAQVEPTWLEQVGAFGDGRRHPTETDLSVAYVGVVPQGAPTPANEDSTWFALSDVPALTPRQRALLDAALEAIRLRLDQAPIAFRLLPPTFTLSELQQTYELLLGRRLHKASFRRALQAAWLVEPTDEWRSEGRGRPAQLFRYAPRRRRSQRRGVRFDLLSG
jgi:8-oxo-dGTP diphosphatase